MMGSISALRWLGSYARTVRWRGRPGRAAPVHVLLCIADHFEPRWGGASEVRARARVERWLEVYPQMFSRFRDSDGRPPRHTFFYPIDQYDAGQVESLGELCAAGFGEVEIHLHHDDDTGENLRRTLETYRTIFHEAHGLLPRDAAGRVRYGFVHGNWALCNGRRDGRWCGVDEELGVLAETGCYADFTMPSAPDGTQSRKLNSIYHAVDRPGRARGYDRGVNVGAGPAPAGGLMMIQGPLILDWGRRKWGLLPRLENGCIQANQPPTMHRLERWLSARVQVAGRGDWFFVKLHTHGGPEGNQGVLLGEAMSAFHTGLSRRAAGDPGFHYHYVTAREMYNLARAAEAGWSGSVDGARDYELAPPEAGGEIPDGYRSQQASYAGREGAEVACADLVGRR